ncbi:MAG: DNA replication and repair protein RecF [Gemmatimonadaceae bacterium]
MALPEVLSPVAGSGRVWLDRLRIRDFRNLEPADFALPPDGLALVGDNGEGKTNFLEAIYYLQLLRSFRGARDPELVRFGASGFHLAAGIGGARASEVAVGFDRGGPARGEGTSGRGRKRVRVDGAEPTRLSDALGSLPAVIFSPQDAVLVTGAPSERRRFLDVILAVTSRPYLAALQRYRAALANRNAALREAASAGTRASEGAVAAWEPALAETGAVLWLARQAWVGAHAVQFAALCSAIGERGESRLAYVTRLDHALGPRDVTGALLEALERKRALDIRRGLTHAGPHRDDLAIRLDGRELRSYGSAGQQRTAAIALRLLEAATLRASAGSEPLVLLDDPFAELDARRAGQILELLRAEERGQTLLVVPRASDIPADLTRLERWRVEGGALSPGTR